VLPFVEEIHIDKVESKGKDSKNEEIEVSINKSGKNFEGKNI